MTALVDLFFGYRGRINRAKFLLASLLWIVVAIAGFTLVYFITGSMTSVETWILVTILAVPGCWSTVVLGIKRLHDRNRTGWWIVPIYLVPPFFDRVADMADRDGNFILQVIAFVASLAISLWIFVELVCLRGTIGPNQYGPDPVTRDISTG